MVIAYHSTFTTYGFWLSNDSRGSWSDFVRSFDLYLTGLQPRRTKPVRSRGARSTGTNATVRVRR